MNDAGHERRIPRRLGALLAGMMAIVALSLATDAAMYASGVFPPRGLPMAASLWLLAVLYRFVYGVLGCHLAARLAPDRPMLHALSLGAVGLALGLVGVVVTRDRGPEFGPGWYSLAVLLIQVPCAWLGGRLGRARAAG